MQDLGRQNETRSLCTEGFGSSLFFLQQFCIQLRNSKKLTTEHL
jgi:hypothetical protein